ncbi:hypothetical protein E4N46_11320 [Salmonella enterica subsp. enterica serovar Adelaide]|nr:hypothetical protein [Salmonella enterica subsp. enterica serovar Adelaide]
MTNNKLTDERLSKILSETQETINDHNRRCVRGSVEVDARLFEEVLLELQLRRQADKNYFMYGIATPEGRAYLDEFCVSSDRGLMEDEVAALNDTFDTNGYRVVALYTALPLTDSERAELQERRKADGAEPIYQLFDAGWYDTNKSTYDTVTGMGMKGRIVYATHS